MMAQVITIDGLVDEDGLTWKLWREDAGASWSIVHELYDATGRLVRRDAWVNFKGAPVPTADVRIGEF